MKIMNMYKNVRLPKENKIYWENQLQEFADRFDSKKIKSVHFGKQDSRGTESITLFNLKDCVPKQVHFKNKWAMLGYIQGFNSSVTEWDFKGFIN